MNLKKSTVAMKSKNLGSAVLADVNKKLRYEKTRAAISFDAADIAGLSPGEISGFLQSLIRTCALLGKQELVISNIAPQVRLGKDDLGVVPDIYDEFIAYFAKAFNAQRQNLPVHRMVLRRGEFDIRFYVGQQRPTDYEFEDNKPCRFH